jgi:hypothetical protein
MPVPAAPGVCELCDNSELCTWPREATRTYRDDFGFVYRVCETHYTSLTVGLLRIFQRRAKRRTAVPSLPRMGVPRRAWRDRPKGPRGRDGPFATPAEQRRAREAVGWSLRRLARELDRSYSQLQSAESGRRPVDPLVAAWVRSVLDRPVSPAAQAQVRRALGRVFAKQEAEEEVPR